MRPQSTPRSRTRVRRVSSRLGVVRHVLESLPTAKVHWAAVHYLGITQAVVQRATPRDRCCNLSWHRQSRPDRGSEGRDHHYVFSVPKINKNPEEENDAVADPERRGFRVFSRAREGHIKIAPICRVRVPRVGRVSPRDVAPTRTQDLKDRDGTSLAPGRGAKPKEAGKAEPKLRGDSRNRLPVEPPTRTRPRPRRPDACTHYSKPASSHCDPPFRQRRSRSSILHVNSGLPSCRFTLLWASHIQTQSSSREATLPNGQNEEMGMSECKRGAGVKEPPCRNAKLWTYRGGLSSSPALKSCAQ